MVFEYEGQTWTVSPTTRDHNSVFHAIFGTRETENDPHTENIAHIRRMNWLNFLTFYEDRARPRYLKKALRTLFQKHDWSIEDNNDFKEYVRLAGEERHVFPEELVILAALENIRIVFFHDDQKLHQIIEPISEILDDYPFVSSSSFETVVIALIGDAYSKLTPQDTSEDDGGKQKSSGVKYKKTYFGSLAGISYQINLLTIVVLNALKKCITWRLSTEAKRAGYFDDLVLEWGPHRYAFLLQAKNRHRKKVVTLTDFFNRKLSGFYLPSYFFSYLIVSHNYNISNVVLCTNTEVRFDAFKECVITRNLTDDDLLYFEGTSSVCCSFSTEILPLFLENFKDHAVEYRADPDLVTEDNIKSFIKDFQIISSYPGPIELEKVIEDKIIRMGISEKFESTNCARHLNKKVIEWFDNEKGQYLTPLHAKTIFSEIRSKLFLSKLHRLGLELKPDKLHLAITKKITHIVPTGDQTLSLLKVFKFLEEEEDRTLFLSTRESRFIQKMMVEAFEALSVKYFVIYKTEPVQSPLDLCEIVARSLNKFGDKKVILISDRLDDMAKLLRVYDHTMFETLYDDVTFTDFTEASQEELLDKAVLFYEASL